MSLRGIELLRDRLNQVEWKLRDRPPVDALSASLYEMGTELAALDDEGLARMAEELDIVPPGPEDKPDAPVVRMGITVEDVRAMAALYSR